MLIFVNVFAPEVIVLVNKDLLQAFTYLQRQEHANNLKVHIENSQNKSNEKISEFAVYCKCWKTLDKKKYWPARFIMKT